MDEAGVDCALIHPVLSDRDCNDKDAGIAAPVRWMTLASCEGLEAARFGSATGWKTADRPRRMR